jgi:hypothetical protein
MHPGVDQVIIATWSGKVLEIRAFRWLEGAFRGTAIPFGG